MEMQYYVLLFLSRDPDEEGNWGRKVGVALSVNAEAGKRSGRNRGEDGNGALGWREESRSQEMFSRACKQAVSQNQRVMSTVLTAYLRRY